MPTFAVVDVSGSIFVVLMLLHFFTLLLQYMIFSDDNAPLLEVVDGVG